MARGMKFRIKEVEGLYYPFSENKGADQLRGYREADLRLFFSHMQNIGFHMTWLIYFIAFWLFLQLYLVKLIHENG